ncbi:FadR/GntR family transcriptional regulator [Cellulomonas aerilata]|uniref:GntR family transcriptional regulator n=1 Tax=Cellulomonas aerilata TaxID=515326 RepID=A0A512DD80_9CELL|nr:FadR/GntR family transcriptional regulator [Cellulomonas aerilata]GEO34170.1 GntR family transcriptional regulator [Cellulomonas aerilata]
MALTDDAITQIKAMITSGELKPGDRLPREADLAALIGVSRNSLREAVRALSMVRILDVRQGDGTYVSSMSTDSLLESLSFLLEFRRDSGVVEFLQVRRILEPAAAAIAARTMTPEQVAGLRASVQATGASTDVTELVRHDLAFHSAIAVSTGNAVLASMVDTVSMPTERARIWRGLTDENAVARTIEEHLRIIEAIESHDPELASARTLVHISGVLQWLQRAGEQASGD